MGSVSRAPNGRSSPAAGGSRHVDQFFGRSTVSRQMLAAPPVTKFMPPRLPSTLVDRKSLITRLEIGSAPVTLVMGFAGAGKTVLMTAWLDAHPERVAAWLSCDSWDSDAERFWTAIITALRRIA